MTLTPRAVRLDLKCGKGAISKGERCHKGPARQAKEENKNEQLRKLATVGLGIAATGGAIAITPRLLRTVLRKKNSGVGRTSAASAEGTFIPHPSHKPSSEWFDLPNGPGLHEGHRMRRYDVNSKMRTIDTEEYANTLLSVRSTPEARRVAALIKKQKIQLDPKTISKLMQVPEVPASNKLQLHEFERILKTNPIAEGCYFDPHHPGYEKSDKRLIWMSFRRKRNDTWTVNKTDLDQSLDKYWVARTKSPIDSTKVSQSNLSDFIKSYTSYGEAADDTRDLILAMHETGHALDFGLGRRSFQTSVRSLKSGKAVSISSPEFKAEALKSISHYGMSDFDTSKSEFFAEAFALYTLSPKNLLSRSPMVYDWVDSYISSLEKM